MSIVKLRNTWVLLRDAVDALGWRRVAVSAWRIYGPPAMTERTILLLTAIMAFVLAAIVAFVGSALSGVLA